MGASAQAATKEIYLLVGTQGADKAKADLVDFDRAVKKTTDSAKDQAKSTDKLSDAWERLGKIKEKTNQALEKVGFALAGVSLAMGGAIGIVGNVVTVFGDFIESITHAEEREKKLKDSIAATNQKIIEQKKHLQEVADLQFGSFNAARGRLASMAGVDTSAMSPRQLAAAEALAQRQDALTLSRNAKEREYVEILREQAALQARARSLGDVTQGNVIQAGALFNQARLSGQRRAAAESALRQYREQQVEIEREFRRVAGADLNAPGAAGGGAAKDDGQTKALVDAIRDRIAAFVNGLFEEKAARDKLFAASDKAAAEFRKKQEDDFKASADLYRQQKEALAKRQEEAYSAGKEAGGSGGMFAFIGEDLGAQNAADKIRGIQDAIHEGITRPAQIAKEATDQLGHGLADAAAAAILEGKSFKAAANEVLKSVARKALAMAIFEGAAALASLAILDFRGAALHGQAAATYGIVAGVAALGASATGGLRSGSGGGSSSGGTGVGAPKANTNGSGSGSGGATVYNFQVNYNGIRTSTRDHEDLIRLLNSQAGRNGAAKLDRRLVA